MVQILPYVPNFMERLAPVLTEAGGQIGQGLQKRQAGKAFSKWFEPQGGQGQQNTQVNNVLAGAQPGVQPGTQVDAATAQAPQAQGMSKFDEMMNRVGGPKPFEIMALGDAAKQAGYDPTVLTTSLLDQGKEAMKEAREIRGEERSLGVGAAKGFFDQTETDRIRLPSEEISLGAMEDAVLSGGIDPFSGPHIAEMAKGLGASESLLKILESPESKEFKTARKTFIADSMKDAFRGTTNQREIQLIEEMMAEVGVSKEGNLAAVWGMRIPLDIKRERLRLADEFRTQGVSLSKIPMAVDKAMKPYIKQLKDEYFEAISVLRKGKKEAIDGK